MSRMLPRDAALPQLARALDPQAMAQAFGETLSGAQVQACQVERIKYRPGRNCTVSYLLQLRDARRGHEFEQRVAARVCSGGDSARRHLKAAGRASVASAAGPALQHLAKLDMLAHWWPNDAKLDAVAILHDDAGLRRRCLDDVVAALTGGHGGWMGHRLSLVQYVPEARVCARVELRLRRAPGAPVTTHTLYAKADAQPRGAATHAVMRALSDSAAQAGGRLCTPQPVLWHEATGLHWQLAVPGRTLLDADCQVGPAVSARVGQQLAALHATPVPASRTTTAGAWRQQPRQVAEFLGQVEPAWQPLLTRLVGRLEARTRGLEHEALVTLHGDLHPRNILLDGDRLTLIDLDAVRLGAAVTELGAWVADALYRAVLAGVAPQRAAPSWRAFLAAYADAAGRTTDESLLAATTAHNLLCQRAYRCVANLKPGRYEVVPRLLELANAIAGAGTIDAAISLAGESV